MADYYLHASSQAAFATAMQNLGLFPGGVFTYTGVTLPSRGNWRLRTRGMITPPLAQSTPQPYNPAVNSDNVGLPSQPEIAFVNNPKVNMLMAVPGVPVYEARIDWNSPDPLPNFVGQGLTVIPITQ